MHGQQNIKKLYILLSFSRLTQSKILWTYCPPGWKY